MPLSLPAGTSRSAGSVAAVLSRLLPLVLAPAIALTALAPPSSSAAEPTPGGVVGAGITDLGDAVTRAAQDLAEGTRRLEQGQAHLADVRARGAVVRGDAQRAADVAADTRARLHDMVGAAYRSPRPDQLSLAFTEPGRLAETLQATASLEHVQGRQSDVVQQAEAARLSAQGLVQEADRLEAEAVEQERALAGELAALQDQAEQARLRLESAAAEQGAARARRDEAARRADRGRGGVGPGEVSAVPAGACGGGSLQGFANGLLPSSALCPLEGTQGLLLRADAAAAFNRMAAAGGMPCAGNSYRSYSEQVALYRVKPSLAAVPGTSNHGWGVAVDFACGAESFGSAGYLWLKAHGPTYGWTHPSWAEPGGNRPEPWHWEYTG